jgi:putative hemolysin
VKTLDGWNEVEASLRLRHDVFHLKHHGRRLPTGLDVDEVDSQCDPFGVFDVNGNLRASYRRTATDRYPVRVRPEARALDATRATEPGPIPSLFASSLRAGACIAGEPAKDPFLGSVDFLAVLELETMSARFRRKYGLA